MKPSLLKRHHESNHAEKRIKIVVTFSDLVGISSDSAWTRQNRTTKTWQVVPKHALKFLSSAVFLKVCVATHWCVAKNLQVCREFFEK